ncbi:MAG: universal stress protein [Chitinophagaceae bacterium]
MQRLFNTMLIPVDFSRNTELAVKKGIELSGDTTVIHLLHVQSSEKYLFVSDQRENNGHGMAEGYRHIEKCLHQWKLSIEESHPFIKVCTWNVMAGSVEHTVIKKAVQLKADLIIIGKNSNHPWLRFLNTVNPGQIIRETGIPVLTVKQGSFHTKIRKIVVPVSSRSVQDKMQIVAALGKRFRIHVYIVTIMIDSSEPIGFYASTLLDLYKWIKTVVGCPVEYAVLKGRNKARAILKYASGINADVLLLYPDAETKVGWMNTDICDILPSTTNLEVLTVQPFHSATA